MQTILLNRKHLTGLVLTELLMVLIGLDQLLPILVILSLFFLFYRTQYRFSLLSILFVFVLVGILTSLPFITEPKRYLSFTRDFLQYVALASLFLLADQKPKQVYYWLMHFLISVLIVSLFAGAIFLLVGNLTFHSLIAMVTPKALLNIPTIDSLFVKRLGTESFLFIKIRRVASFMSSAIQFAAFLTSMIFIIWVGIRESKAKTILLVSSILMLIFTLSRTTMLVVFPLVFLYTFVRKYARYSSPFRALILISTFLLGILLVALVLSQIDAIAQFLNHFFFETRKSSGEQRMEVYRLTVHALLSHGGFGHGTQVSVPGMVIPLGSHNWFLGILFKYGFHTFLVFSVFIWLIFFKTIKATIRSQGDDRIMGIGLLMGLTAISTLSFTLEPILDLMTFLALCLLFVMAKIYGEANYGNIKTD